MLAAFSQQLIVKVVAHVANVPGLHVLKVFAIIYFEPNTNNATKFKYLAMIVGGVHADTLNYGVMLLTVFLKLVWC